MLRAFWGAAPRTDCWTGMRARDLLASIMEGIIKTKVGCVAVSGVLAHGLAVAGDSGGASEFRNPPAR